MFALKHKIRSSAGNQVNGANGSGVVGGGSSKNERKNAKEEVLFSRSRIVLKDQAASVEKETILEVSDIIDDEDDEDIHERNVSFANRSPRSSISTLSSMKLNSTSKPIDIETAKKLKILLIGDSTKIIGTEWSGQYFDFDTRLPELWYGLVQHHGGPCGLMAVVQGYLCAEFFHHHQVKPSEKELASLETYRYRCLARALATLLWQIGGSKHKVVIAFESNRVYPGQIQLQPAVDFRPDGITEHLRLSVDLTDMEQIVAFLTQLLIINSQALGAISLVYSCILTRGIDQIRNDYDSGSIETLLTPERLLCTQELVNLTLIGRAVSNVFDRNFTMSEVTLQGITRQSTIGFLTMHEYEGAFKVGTCYKNPKFPVFVVLSDYHFTLLFSKQKVGELEKGKSTALVSSNDGTVFDLFYYDGLLEQDQEIRLTIDTDPMEVDSPWSSKEGGKNDAVPCPIECVIRTKWPHAKIDWNDTSKVY